jgi:hypothetical protein
MLSELIVGPRFAGDSSQVAQRAAKDGTTVVTDAHGRYYEQVYRGNAFFLNLAAGAATAFTGGAGGTPLLAVYNPPGSGKNLIIVAVGVANRVAASAAGVVSFGLWGGPTANITGTQTNPTNMLSLAASGSTAKGFVNTALTGSTAVGQILPLATYYWATAASALLTPVFCDVGGLVIVAPGNMAALGGTAALTSATYDATVIWEEQPV